MPNIYAKNRKSVEPFIINRERWVFGLFLVTLFWAPIPLGSNRPWAWGLLEVLCFAVFFASVYFYKSALLKQIKTHTAAFYSLGLLSIWVFIQQLPLPTTIVALLSPHAHYYHNFASEAFGSITSFSTLSVDPQQTSVGLFKTLSYIALFIATLLLCNTENRIRWVLLTLIGTGLFQAMYGSLEVLLRLDNSLVFQLPVKGIATGTFVYRNHYANFLMLCLSMGVGYLVSTLLSHSPSNRKAKLRSFLTTLLSGKAVVRIVLAIMVIALVMSRSRMGNTAFFVAMTLVGLLALALLKRRTKGLTILIVSMFIVDMFIVSAWFGLDKVKDRLENTSFAEETRDEVVRDSLPFVKQFWLTGSGLGSYYTIYPIKQSEEVKAFYDHAHNDYLQFAIELGVIGCIGLAVLFLYCINTAFNSLRTRKNTLMQGLAFGCLMSMVGMAIHIFVDFPLQSPANSLLFMVILALSLVSTMPTKSGSMNRK